MLVLARLDRRAPAPTLLATALAGAVVATALSAAVSDRLQGWIAAVAPAADARLLATAAAVPVVEELAKAAALVAMAALWPRTLDGAVGGIVHGAPLGLGFAARENVLYLTVAALQGGYGGLARSAYLRGLLYGANHALFTATTAVALAHARTRRSRPRAALVAAAGIAAAAAQHVAWNAVASPAIERVLCGGASADAACRALPSALSLYVTVPAIAALFVAPGAIALVIVARRLDRRAASPARG